MLRPLSFATHFMVICFGASLISTLYSVLLASESAKSQQSSSQTLAYSGASGVATCVDCPLAHVPVANSDVVAVPPELVVDLSDRRVYIYRSHHLEKSYPVAIGKADWETPIGVFQVMDKQQNPTWQNPITGKIIPPGPTNPLGVAWIGFWVDGGHQIGFHGTPEEASIGEAISHGCVRMRNKDILELFNEVQEGWTVTIRP
jgi:hypothetical protein